MQDAGRRRKAELNFSLLALVASRRRAFARRGQG